MWGVWEVWEVLGGNPKKYKGVLKIGFGIKEWVLGHAKQTVGDFDKRVVLIKTKIGCC